MAAKFSLLGTVFEKKTFIIQYPKFVLIIHSCCEKKFMNVFISFITARCLNFFFIFSTSFCKRKRGTVNAKMTAILYPEIKV